MVTFAVNVGRESDEHAPPRRRYADAVIEFAVVMGVIALFVLVLVGGLELIEQAKKRTELKVDPEQLLAARFAKGEIDELEYSRRLSVLRLGPPLQIPD